MAKKTSDGPEPRRVASPAATGGAGTHFEQHVDAAFLSLLVLRAIPPVLTDCVVTEVHLQAEHLGWATDDQIIVGTSGSGAQRRLFCQAKRSFTVSASNNDCEKAIGDFWRDLKTNADFSAADDRFAIVVQRGTDKLLHHFVGLLDCARSSQDGADFERRLGVPGFLNATAVHYTEEIKTIVGRIEQRPVSIVELWPFLKLLHVLPMDLHSSTRLAEAEIKTMLAFASKGVDPAGTANATWDDLLREASKGMSCARSYRYEDLPQNVRDRHAPLADSSPQVLQRLSEHSAVILGGIRSTIGAGLCLRRDALVQSLLGQLEETRVVLVTGPAGSGKSAIAKAGISQFRDDFTFSFRAEEFATIHLDESLQKIQIPATAASIRAVLSAQSRKVLLVESVERLLEAVTRDAFADLLRLVKDDPTWRLVLTCREYSAETVRSSLLAFVSLSHSVVTVPPLADHELKTVATSLPGLARPIADMRLRRLLGNPYLLDKASQMEWAEAGPLPADERAFRAKFWREIVRAEHAPANDMPRRREDALGVIALRRARALTQYVSRSDMDGHAVHALRRDSLLSFSAESDLLVAPAHDVLEDWAIVRWIEEQFASCERSLPVLADVLGAHAAIRRTYRKWVTEKVEQEPEVADQMMNAVIAEPSLSAHFRDDTLVSLLQSPASRDLLQRHSASLFANGRQLLHRAVHLVRVACVKAPSWLPPGAAGAVLSTMHVPDGSVWTTVLELVASRVNMLDRADLPLILGFVEDSARGITWQSPNPPGAAQISAIVYWLLSHLDSYRAREQRKRVLQILAKVPKENPEPFRALLVGDPDGEAAQRGCEILREIVLWGMDGMAASRDMPEVVLQALQDELVLTVDELQGGVFGGALELEPHFGIRECAQFSGFPASAFHGPFQYLLWYHPKRTLDFLIALFNHSADWYAAPRVPLDYVEPPFSTTLTFADGTAVTQWCNSRLWNLYRGTSVGPNVLQSALMALERCLLDIGDAQPDRLDDLLCDILRRSSNAAVTAAVASVATASPHVCPETLLVLLSSRECILLDRGRLAVENQAATLNRMFPHYGAEQRVYSEERKEANCLPHRTYDLEAAIANLQLGPHRHRVYESIDKHRAGMPPVDQQTESDRIWRLALHRMDLRQYTVAEEQESQQITQADQASDRQTIRLDPKKADADVQQMVDDSTADFAAMDARISLLMWGVKAFGREEGQAYDPSDWKARLQQAQNLGDRPVQRDELDPGAGRAEYVAAVCVRDHFDKLTKDEVSWCVDTICAAIERDVNSWHHLARVQHYSLSGDRPAASVVSILAGKPLNGDSRDRVMNALAYAVLHPINEMRAYAASGVGQQLWAIDPGLAMRCVNVLATEAHLVQERRRTERRQPFDGRLDHNEIEADVAVRLRANFYSDQIDEDAYQNLDASDWTGAEAYMRILSILARGPRDGRAIEAFRRLAAILVEWWDSDDKRGSKRERSIEVEVALTGLLEEFVLYLDATQGELILRPILDAVDRHPRRSSQILRGIVGVEDRMQKTEQFWRLWELFAAEVRGASWLRHLGRPDAEGVDAIGTIFLTRFWKDGIEHWRSLDGHVARVHQLFEKLPKSATVVDAYIRFLYHIGRKSLPDAFVRIANALKAGNAQLLLRMDNAVFMLETLLCAHVYGRPLQLKRYPELRESVLFLLDVLVERGSSAAYRMRDDFATPMADGQC